MFSFLSKYRSTPADSADPQRRLNRRSTADSPLWDDLAQAAKPVPIDQAQISRSEQWIRRLAPRPSFPLIASLFRAGWTVALILPVLAMAALHSWLHAPAQSLPILPEQTLYSESPKASSPPSSPPPAESMSSSAPWTVAPSASASIDLSGFVPDAITSPSSAFVPKARGKKNAPKSIAKPPMKTDKDKRGIDKIF